jgi:hypothetical protein
VKADGLWSSLAAAMFLRGPSTLAGCMSRIDGGTATSTGFAGGDYDRLTGVVGGTGKYITLGRNNNTDSQNNQHAAVWATSLDVVSPGTFALLIAGRVSGTGDGSTKIVFQGTTNPTPNTVLFGSRLGSTVSIAQSTGFLGVSRSASGTYTTRIGGTSTSQSGSSLTPANAPIYVLARTIGGSGEAFSACRVAFASAGPTLDLSLLNSRLTTLFAALV